MRLILKKLTAVTAKFILELFALNFTKPFEKVKYISWALQINTKKIPKGFSVTFVKKIKTQESNSHPSISILSSLSPRLFSFFIPAVRYLFIDHQAAWLSLHAGQL